jgi:hypothetical protein
MKGQTRKNLTETLSGQEDLHKLTTQRTLDPELGVVQKCYFAAKHKTQE